VRILHIFSAPFPQKEATQAKDTNVWTPCMRSDPLLPSTATPHHFPHSERQCCFSRPVSTTDRSPRLHRMPTHSTPCSIVWSLTSLDKKTNHENKTNKKRKSHFPFARTLFPPHSAQTFLYQTHIYCPGALGECTASYGILSPASFASSQFCRPKRRPQRTTSGCFNSSCPQSSPRPPALITTDPPHTTVSNIALLRQPRMDYLPQGYCWRGWYT
jgi:hypothetical protein